MTDYQKVKLLTLNKLKKALLHFEYSANKVKNLKTDVALLSEEELEVWESFSSRFSRLTDIFLSRWLRVHILEQDPAFRGTFRDLLNWGEKQGLLTESTRWFAIRELRNKSEHDYDDEDISFFFKSLLLESNFVMSEIKKAVA